MNRLILAIALAAFACTSSQAAPFQNLSFDNANTNAVDFWGGLWSGSGQTSELLPGWEVYLNATLEDEVFFNEVPLNPGAYAALFSADPRSSLGRRFTPEGPYAVYFMSDGFGGSGSYYSITQGGQIPPGAVFLRYRYLENPFGVTINGQTLPAVSADFGYTFLGEPLHALYDVRAFAGQEVELRLAATNDFAVQHFPVHYLDSVQFASWPPSLEIRRADNQMVVSWPTSTFGYILQSTPALLPKAVWHNVPTTPVVVDDRFTVTLEPDEAASFYRLGMD